MELKSVNLVDSSSSGRYFSMSKGFYVSFGLCNQGRDP